MTSATTSTAKPRLCFVGPNLGCHAGWVVTQGEILARLFDGDGYPVLATSSVRQPTLRFADMAWSLLRWRRRIDVVVLSVFSGRAFHIADAVSALCRALGLPQVLVLRGGGLPELMHQHPRRAKRVLSRAQAVVSPSGFLAEQVRALGLASDEIPNVLDLEKYPFRQRRELPQPLRLLWVRTFHPIYNPLLALDTLAALHDSGLPAGLTMAGQDKGLEAACRERAAQLGLSDAVAFPGFLDMAQKQRLFAEHDVFLNTNRVDNMPVTVLEATAFGLPVVATRVGGIPFLLDDQETGLLVPDGDTTAMRDAVARLANEPALTAKLSHQGRQLAEQCAWPTVQQRWDDLFQRLGPPAAAVAREQV